jgi:hypothetical protein
MTMRDRRTAALSARCPPVKARHLGPHRRLVDKDKLLRVEIALSRPTPDAPPSRRLVLARPHEPSFFERNPATREEAPGRSNPNRCPRSSFSFAWRSSSVIAGVLSTSPRMQSASFSTHADRRSPPCFLGARVPLVSCCSAQRTALAALTLNQAATCRRDIPCPIASTTRCRRSTESARAMHAGLLTSMPLQSQARTVGNASQLSPFGKCSSLLALPDCEVRRNVRGELGKARCQPGVA